MTISLRETAYTKINLALHVRGRRDDGYHAIETCFAFLTEGDRLSAAAGDQLSLAITGPFAQPLVRNTADNLVMQAARAMKTRFAPSRGATLTLEKYLPVASGIGGGSADAAAAIRLLDRLWGLDRPLSDYASLAADLGADVPACLFSRTAIGTGKGEQLDFCNIAGLDGVSVLLANPGVGVSTAEIFRRWDGRDGGPLPSGDLAACFNAGRNDLEAPAIALVPAIGDLLAAMRRHSGHVRMSGSGATCFALFPAHHDAIAAQEALRAQFAPLWTMVARPRQSSCTAAFPAPLEAPT